MITFKISNNTETSRLECGRSFLCPLPLEGCFFCLYLCSDWLYTHITPKRIYMLVTYMLTDCFLEYFYHLYCSNMRMSVLVRVEGTWQNDICSFWRKIVQYISKAVKVFKLILSLSVILIFGIYTKELIQNIGKSVYWEQGSLLQGYV